METGRFERTVGIGSRPGPIFFANGFMNALHDEHGHLIGYAKIMTDETARNNCRIRLRNRIPPWSSSLTSPVTICRSRSARCGCTRNCLTQKYEGQLDADEDQFLGFIVVCAWAPGEGLARLWTPDDGKGTAVLGRAG